MDQNWREVHIWERGTYSPPRVYGFVTIYCMLKISGAVFEQHAALSHEQCKCMQLWTV